MQPPLVSVIIPTYNRQRLLLRAIESVLMQDYRPIELVIVDDGSKDGSLEAIEIAIASFPVPTKLVQLTVNQGPSAARNAGLDAAAGEYVAFLDSDDYWLQGKLTQQIGLIEAHPAPGNVITFSQSRIDRRHDSVIRPRRGKCPGEPLDNYLFAAGDYIPMGSIVVSARLARKVKFDSSLRLHEDWDFLLRIEQIGGEFVLLPQALCVIEDIELAGRASAPHPGLSLSWLEKRKHIMSPAAYLGLRARIAPQLRNKRFFLALSFILRAWVDRAINHWTLLTLIGRLVHPSVRGVAYRVRGALQRRTTRLSHGEKICDLSRLWKPARHE